jgi:hypothetical protein
MTNEFYVRIKKQHLVLVLGIAAALSIAAMLAFPVQTAVSDHTLDDVVCPTSHCVNGADIAANAVGSAKIKNGEVTSLDIRDRGVSADDLASDSVTSRQIAEGEIGRDYRDIAPDFTFPGTVRITAYLRDVFDNGIAGEPSLFGLDDSVSNIEITCFDPDGCRIPSTSPLLDIDLGAPGQILILSARNSYNIRIDEQISAPAGVTEINLASGSRTLSNNDDTLILLFTTDPGTENRWIELSYKTLGPS